MSTSVPGAQRYNLPGFTIKVDPAFLHLHHDQSQYAIVRHVSLSHRHHSTVTVHTASIKTFKFCMISACASIIAQVAASARPSSVVRPIAVIFQKRGYAPKEEEGSR
jgi:hypothetical protein